MGYGRQSRQNRKENPVGNWTFRLRKMQKILPRYPEQKEDLRLLETDSVPTLICFPDRQFIFSNYMHFLPKSLQHSYFLSSGLGIQKDKEGTKILVFLIYCTCLVCYSFFAAIESSPNGSPQT